MNTSQKKKYYILFAIIYLVLLTVIFLLPANYFPVIPIRYIDLCVHFISYGLFTWLALAALGSCPLRWRSIAPWVFLIAFAHAYWMEFLQGMLLQLHRQSSYLDLLAGIIGALVGIFLRLQFAYKQCNCSLMNRELRAGIHRQAATGERQLNFNALHPLTISDHPGLAGIIAKSFKWKTLRLYPEPGIIMDMVCTGKSLVSLPHFSYGSITNNTSSEIDWQQVLEKYALPRNIAQMEIRQASPAETARSLKTSSWLPLYNTLDEQLKGFSPNLRRKIRKGIRIGFYTRQGGLELLNDFWMIYAHHLDKLGSVAPPKRFFATLLKEYTVGNALIFILYKRDKVVGGAFNLAYKGFYENGWFATLHKYQKEYASYALHHAMIEHAIGLKCHTYSFGRSTTGSGVHRFKQQWGTKDVPLKWVQYPAQQVNLRKQTWLGEIWKLLPWPIRKYVGRYLAKWIY